MLYKKKVIGCKWLYKVKFNVDKFVERYNVKLVANQFSKKKWLNYHETFYLVAKIVSIRSLLALATLKGWYLHQFDVNNKFLRRDLNKDVYIVT